MSFPGLNLQRWAAVLRGRLLTDKPCEDSAADAARALVEVLDPQHVERLADSLLEVVPGLAEKYTSKVLADLCEEVVKRDPHDSFATVELINQIQKKWRQEQ